MVEISAWPRISGAPVYCPTPEEFDDPIKYVQKIYNVVVKYGICKIRPPSYWRPPTLLNDTVFSFAPRVQRLFDVSPYNQRKRHFMRLLSKYWESENSDVFRELANDIQVDVFKLYQAVKKLGGYNNVCSQNEWIAICKLLGFEDSPDMASTVCSNYRTLILPFEPFYDSNTDLLLAQDENSLKNSGAPEEMLNFFICKRCNKSNKFDQMLICDECYFEGVYHTFCLDFPLSYTPKRWICPKCFAKMFNNKNGINDFGFRSSGALCTLRDFSDMADEFKINYFKKPLETITLAEVGDEFWRIVNDSECDIILQYGAGLPSPKNCSGFPTAPCTVHSVDYYSSPWNLNNLARNPLSALRYLPDNVKCMKVPCCYVGMVFSYFRWSTEDHWSFSINYLHKGEPKTWYGVPGEYADAFEAAMESEVSQSFDCSHDFLHQMTTLLPPDRLLHRGVPVYRLDQLAGEFVVTFPRAYHAGYNNGFNFAEAVNFCPLEWFPFGLRCVNHYALLHRPPVFSHAELLCRLADSGMDGNKMPISLLLIVVDQLAELLVKERSLRRHLVRLGVRRTERITFETRNGESRACQLCKTILFTSALTCSCSKSLLCLEHYQSCTCCPAEEQILLYRYGLDELSQFVERPQARVREYRTWKTRVNDFLRAYTSVMKEIEGEKEWQGVVSDRRGTQVIEKFVEQTNERSPEGNSSKSKMPLRELVKLREVGRQNNYPDDLVTALSKIIEMAETCVSMIRTLGTQKLEDLGWYSSAISTPEHIYSSKALGTTKVNLDELDLPTKPLVTKITMSEFEKYVEMANNLPCIVPEVEELNRFKKRLEEWQISARELLIIAEQPISKGNAGDLTCRLPEAHLIEPLVIFAKGVDVELRDLRGLAHLLKCMSWLESVEKIMKPKTAMDEDCPSLNDLIELDARGQMLAYVLHPDRLNSPPLEMEEHATLTALESALVSGSAQLQKVIFETQSLETAIKAILKAPSGTCKLFEAEALAVQASGLKVTFDASKKLVRLCSKARILLDHFTYFSHLLDCFPAKTDKKTKGVMRKENDQGLKVVRKRKVEDRFPEEFTRRLKLNTADSTPRVWLKYYEEICNAANRLPFIFPDTHKIKTLLTALDRCYERIKVAFLPSDDERAFSPALLLEILLPRPKSAYRMLIQRDARTSPTGSSRSISGLSHDPSACDARAYAAACKENVLIFLQELSGGSNFDHIYDTVYTPMIENELHLLHYLRRSNLRKSKESDQGAVIYCICRQPGYTGVMLQCELCKDWFHKRCVGFSSKNVDIWRVRYTCPRCERSRRPELSVVIEILEELAPQIVECAPKRDSEEAVTSPEHSPTAILSFTSELMAPLASMPFLLKLPALAAVQMLCERAFAFVRRVRTVIFSTPELRRAFLEYEAFSEIKMQWNIFDEIAMLDASIHQQHSTSPSTSDEHQQNLVDLPRTHLPPDDLRPPGMQPLVLRTTVPRDLVSEMQCHLHHFDDPAAPSSTPPHRPQILTPPSQQELSAPTPEAGDEDGYARVIYCNKPKEQNEGLLITPITTSPTNTVSESVASSKNHLSSTSSHFLPHQSRPRTLSGEGLHQRYGGDGSPTPSIEFNCCVTPDARAWLDTLIGEACALEVGLPHTRWLWQLALAADPECPGALHPRVAYEDEMALRRLVDRRRSLGEEVGSHRRVRYRRYNPFEGSFYATSCMNDTSSRSTSPNYPSSRRRLLGKSLWNSKRQHIASGCEPPSYREKRAGACGREDCRLVKTAQRDLASARRYAAQVTIRRTSTLSQSQRIGSKNSGGKIRISQCQRPVASRKRLREEKETGAEDADEEGQEFCTASNGCKRPRGTVAWVACDKCNYWYHQRCVGIMCAREVPEVYVCRACQVGNGDILRAGKTPLSQSSNSANLWSSPQAELLRGGHTTSPPAVDNEGPEAEAENACKESLPTERACLVPPAEAKLRANTTIEPPPDGTVGAKAWPQAVAALEALPATQAAKTERSAPPTGQSDETRESLE